MRQQLARSSSLSNSAEAETDGTGASAVTGSDEDSPLLLPAVLPVAYGLVAADRLENSFFSA